MLVVWVHVLLMMRVYGSTRGADDESLRLWWYVSFNDFFRFFDRRRDPSPAADAAATDHAAALFSAFSRIFDVCPGGGGGREGGGAPGALVFAGKTDAAGSVDGGNRGRPQVVVSCYTCMCV